MSENLFGLTVAADKGLDDLQCQRLLSENRRYQEVMLQYRCALKALESRLEILNEEFSLQHDRNPIESMIKMLIWSSFMLCIKLHPLTSKMHPLKSKTAPPLNRSCTPLTGFYQN